MPLNPRLILILMIIFGTALRLWNALYAPSLWLDEVFSAKLAESPLLDLLLAVPRFDTHPPLYYLQLHFWSRLGWGDSWLILNSVLIDMLVIASLIRVVGRIHGAETGLWVGAVYAVLPVAVFFAENVRMYPMLFLLVVWLWYMLERRVIDGHATRSARVGTILLGLAATLTHGLGFFVVFFVYLQALARVYLRHRQVGLRPPLLVVLDYLPVALAALYSVGISTFRQTEGVQAFDLEIVGIHLTLSLFGMEAPIPVVAGYLGVLIVLLPPMLARQSRPIMIWLVLVPFATLLMVSLTVKAVFMYRTLGLFSPFMAIALGLFFANVWQERRLFRQAYAGAVLLVLIVASTNSSLTFVKAGYRQIASIWASTSPPDAVLFVGGSVNLWGITRYLDDVPTFSALDIQPPVRDGLLRVKQRLEGSYFDRAGLFGKSDHLLVGTREIWPYDAPQRRATLERYWVLSSTDASCLRPQDIKLRSFTATGQSLAECQNPDVAKGATSATVQG